HFSEQCNSIRDLLFLGLLMPIQPALRKTDHFCRSYTPLPHRLLDAAQVISGLDRGFGKLALPEGVTILIMLDHVAFRASQHDVCNVVITGL
ncbi:MAG TPA: hypothetical protein VNE18_11840, partial [Rhodanobacter sp.]|nr:hypothetical protein [Rhodanobacter sp.]